MKLYGKIFLGFWLAMVAILGSWMVAARYFEYLPSDRIQEQLWRQPDSDARRSPGRFAERPGGRAMGRPGAPRGERFIEPPHFLRGMLYELQHLPQAEMASWIEQQQRDHNVEIFVLSKEGVELFDKSLKPAVSLLAEELKGLRRRAQVATNTHMYIGHDIYRQDSGQLRVIIALPHPGSRVLQILGRNLWLRLVLAIIISGVVCFALSRFMTRRIQLLREATARFAQGDLDSRISVAPSGGDETADLARDFNRMAQQLQDKILGQKRLIHDVSHELRSPLARLRVALALAEKGAGHIDQHLARIETETERLDELIGQLLAVPDSHLAFDDSLDLVTLLQQLVEDANYEARQHAKTVLFKTDEAEVVIRTHGDLLKKAFGNILRNAVAYSASSTTVEVSLRRDTKDVVIWIQDEGPGVPEAELHRLFEAFYRVDETRERGTGGSGLGLSIAQRAIERHGGSVEAVNTGRGLLLISRLPL